MKRTPVNPVTWSLDAGFNQGEVIEGHTRTLYCSGQVAVTDDFATPDDMQAQMTLAFDNVERVLEQAGMGVGDLIDLTIFVADVDAGMAAMAPIIERFDAAGVKPPQTLIGVAALGLQQFKVEIKAVAAQ